MPASRAGCRPTRRCRHAAAATAAQAGTGASRRAAAAASPRKQRRAPPSTPTRSAAVNAEQVKLYFEVGSAIPPTDSKEQLEGLVAKARSRRT